ncbi:MAG: DUF87 domain-containing protein [Candidatus Pacearchaeota archaeon]
MSYDIIIGRDESDKKKFGDKGLLKIGKGYVKMGQYTSLSNNILLDVARSHVILVSGKRGSGKSYSLGVIAEEISNMPLEAKKNIAPLIFDTMGIFWTMKYPNEKEKELLNEWDLKPEKLPIRVFVPYGHFDSYIEKGIPADASFALKVSEMTAEDWVTLFGLDIVNPISILIQRTIHSLKEKKDFYLFDIVEKINSYKEISFEEKNAAIGLFEAAATWGIFASEKQQEILIEEIVKAGETTIIDISVYNSVGAFNVRALVIGLISKKLFNERMSARKQEEIDSVRHGIDYLSHNIKRKYPLVWIFIDEAHEFLPKNSKTPASDALIQLLREGRQPGISLVLATQQPGQIHRDVMTQSDVVISHRLTSKQDILSLNEIMQTYILDDIRQYIDELPKLKGSAIILDDNSERIYSMRLRPRYTWHGGETPTAVKVEKKL